MKFCTFLLFLFSFLAVAQDKGIPPLVKITPTPTATSVVVPKHKKHSAQELLRQHTNPTPSTVAPPLDKKTIKEITRKLKNLTELMTDKSEECSQKSNSLKVHLDKKDYWSSHHILFLHFGNIDPDLPPPSASCQVCLDANEQIKNYFSCLLEGEVGSEFKMLSTDPQFYPYVRKEVTDDAATVEKMQHFYQYLIGLIK